MHLFHLHLKQFIFIILITVLILLFFAVGKQIDYSHVVSSIENNRTLGIPIYVAYAILSVVIIPLPVVPLWPVALFLYGYWPTVLLTILGSITGAVINFILARKFGKPFVQKMLGKKIFNEIEHLINIDNTKTFLLVRFFGNNYFDAISYVAGLSDLSLKKYFSITTVGTIAWTACILFIIQKLGGIENVKSFVSIMGVYGTLILSGTLAWELLHKFHKIGKLRKKRAK